MQGFGVGFVGRDHFRLVAGLFRFDNDANAVFGRSAVVNHEVLPVFGIHEMFVAVPGGFEKIGNDVFEMFFAFLSGMAKMFEQAGEFGFKTFEALAFHILDAVGRMKRFCGRLRD